MLNHAHRLLVSLTMGQRSLALKRVASNIGMKSLNPIRIGLNQVMRRGMKATGMTRNAVANLANKLNRVRRHRPF